MKANLRRTLAGSFTARELGSGAWQLTGGASACTAIYLTGTEPAAAQTLRAARFSSVALEWHEDGVLAMLTSSTGREILKARHATIHEPLTHLYESLPLVSFVVMNRQLDDGETPVASRRPRCRY